VTVTVKRTGPTRARRRVLRNVGGAFAMAPVAAIVGSVAAGLSPLEAAGVATLIVVGVVLVLAILARPEVGALAILVLVAIVPIDTLFNYDIRFLSGGLKVTDLLLLASLGAWAVNRVVDPQPARAPSRAVTHLVLALVALAALGVFTARVSGAELKLSLLELRAIVAFLLVFPIVGGVRRLRDLEVAVAVFLVAVAISDGVIIREFLQGRGGVALFSANALRINNLVYLYPLAGIVWAIALLPFTRDRVVRVLLLALTGLSSAALFFTYRRGAWVVALLAPVIVVALLPRHRRANLGRQLLVMAGAVAIVVAGANQLATRPITSPLESARERLASLGLSAEDISAQHRVAELRRARDLILSHPLTGIGLGATFTFVSPLYDALAESADVPQTNIYVHDSYVWVALKLGLPALVVFLLLLGAVIREAYAGYRLVTDPRASRLMLGALASLVALVVVSLSEPHLTYVGSSPFFVAVIAVSQLIPQLPEARPDLSG
jgi:O-antigen ligase